MVGRTIVGGSLGPSRRAVGQGDGRLNHKRPPRAQQASGGYGCPDRCPANVVECLQDDFRSGGWCTWRPREKLAALFVGAFLIAQLTIPMVQATRPGPARFGWQMYSTIPPGANGEAFVIEDVAGGRDTVRIFDYVVRARWEVEYRRILPPHICDVTPTAAAVLYEHDGTTLDRYPCP